MRAGKKINNTRTNRITNYHIWNNFDPVVMHGIIGDLPAPAMKLLSDQRNYDTSPTLRGGKEIKITSRIINNYKATIKSKFTKIEIINLSSRLTWKKH